MKDKQYVVKNDKDEFLIGYFGSDLYWIMPKYHDNNQFIITNNENQFYTMLLSIFKYMKKRKSPQLKGNVFTWLSEARLPENSSSLIITKQENAFVIQFIQNPNDHLGVARNTCSICFCLSGSRNQSVANEFSIMNHKLLERD